MKQELTLSLRSKPTILLVDDDSAVRESLRRVLVSEGWEIIAACSGETALLRLQESVPNLVITDLRMAGVSGWDLLYHEILERPSLPIFVISALPPEATGGASKLATQFFQKPLEIDALLRAIRSCLAEQVSASKGEPIS